MIIPSHLHLILKPESKTIGEVLQAFGSYTAHAILSELGKDKRDDLLKFFQAQRPDARHEHSIWRIFIATRYTKIGNLLMIGQNINIQLPVFMIGGLHLSFQLLTLTSG